MQLLAPDILEVTRELSSFVCVVAFALGSGLWLFGGRTHRFWLALVITVAAGVVGLEVARDFGVQPVVAAVLMALAAGSLALSLARLAVFVAVGATSLVLARAIANGWNDFLCFIGGGLAGVVLFPIWVCVLSSVAGTLLMAYSLLSVLDRLFHFDSPAWAASNAPLLNWCLAAWALLGVALQYALERKRQKEEEKKKPEEKKPEEKDKKKEEKPPLPVPLPPPPPGPDNTSWWDWPALFGGKNKAA